MSEPAFIVDKERRTLGGSLPGADLNRIGQLLRDGGYVLLPSDTCYSIAALPSSEGTRRDVNTLLGRPDIALSLAFPSLPATRQWITRDPQVEAVLGHFCPGPITVICAAIRSELALPRDFFELGIKVQDRTIGVRIPDAIVERDIAAFTDYPVTTVAVRGPGYSHAIREFSEALEVVSRGMDLIQGHEWCAIEGAAFYADHSTIVRIPGEESVADLVREGDIPFGDIERVVAVAPQGVPYGQLS